MKKRISKKTFCLTAAAAVLVAGLSVGSALAYFTTYTTAEGGVTLDLGFTDTELTEDVVDGRKEIELRNTGDYDCFVRLRALTGEAYKDSIVYSEPDGAGKWSPGEDGYYYYSDILQPGQITTQIDVLINTLKMEIPEGEEPAEFNVIIIQECTPVLYDDNGNPYADWAVKADVSHSIMEGEDEE